jgi:hypothetical protein
MTESRVGPLLDEQLARRVDEDLPRRLIAERRIVFVRIGRGCSHP